MRKKNPYCKRVTTNVTQEDYDAIQRAFANSTCRKLSNYIRRIVTRKPVTFFYRNKSFDELVEEFIRLRREMQVIREKNLPFTIEDAARLLELQQDIKEGINKIVDICTQKLNMQKISGKPLGIVS